VPPSPTAPTAPNRPSADPADPADPVLRASRAFRAGRAAEAREILAPAVLGGRTDADALLLWCDLAEGTPDQARVAEFLRGRAAAAPEDVSLEAIAARALPAADALAALDRLAQKHSQSPWPRGLRARVLLGLGRAADALAEADGALAASPAAEPRFRAVRALALEALGRWPESLDAWKQIAAATPDHPSARLGMAEAHRRLGEIPEAIALLEAQISADPTDPEPHARTALLRLDTGDADAALVAAGKALGADEKHRLALHTAVRAALRKCEAAAAAAKKPAAAADFDPAKAFADRAVEAAPDDADALVLRALVHESAAAADPARWDAALADLAAALDRTPGGSPAAAQIRILQSHALLRAGRPDEAAETALRAAETLPADASGWACAGEALSAAGNDADAVKKAWRPGIKAVPGSARLRHGHGISLWRTGKLTDAARELKEAVRLAPEEGRYRLSYGELLYQAARDKEAGVELLKATELRPEDAVAWSCLGHAYVSNQRWQEAADAFERAVKLDGSLKDENLALAVLWSDRLKDKVKGKEHAKRWRELGGTDPSFDGWIDALLAEK
jgi:tetratricopeptide (TPR) repeat protein